MTGSVHQTWLDDLEDAARRGAPGHIHSNQPECCAKHDLTEGK